jgi:adenosylcobinamide kinase/adenosylcobinamide-phosphate guanylyltransferase
VSGRRIALVGGGVRSGKSSFAVALAKTLGARRTFVATARASDDEMVARIARHQEDRAGAFTTIEAGPALAEVLDGIVDADVVVIDCLTLWLANLLVAGAALPAILADVDRVVAALATRRFHAVLVTNEVGMSVHPETALGRAFVEVCGFAHQRFARAADDVYLAVLGTIVRLSPVTLGNAPGTE